MDQELCVSLKDRGLSPAVDKLQWITVAQLTAEVFSRKDAKAQRKTSAFLCAFASFLCVFARKTSRLDIAYRAQYLPVKNLLYQLRASSTFYTGSVASPVPALRWRARHCNRGA